MISAYADDILLSQDDIQTPFGLWRNFIFLYFDYQTHEVCACHICLVQIEKHFIFCLHSSIIHAKRVTSRAE